jgi:hypothetical protein
MRTGTISPWVTIGIALTALAGCGSGEPAIARAEGAASSSSATWCNGCHGTPPSSGEHGEHGGFDCSRCHGAGYSRTTYNLATHRDGTVNVALPAWNAATRSCGRICHESERWGARGAIGGCADCHDYPTHNPYFRLDCSRCHTTTIDASYRLIAGGTHRNGRLDLTAPYTCNHCHALPTDFHNESLWACQRCHQRTVGPDGQLTYVEHGTGWVGTLTVSCLSCHASFPPRLAGHVVSGECHACHPLAVTADNAPTAAHAPGLNGGSGCAACHGSPPDSGAHARHASQSCGRCHDTSAGRHRNLVVDVSLAAWQPVSRSCASACHASRTWTSGGSSSSGTSGSGSYGGSSAYGHD